jgi:solute:Na+ symporter, SSS family
MAILDISIIILYLLAMVGIGIYFSRKNKSTAQFTTASSTIPGWAIGMSFYATFLSAITFLGDPGKSFGSNWNPFVFSISMPFAAYFSSKFFVSFYRNTGEISAYTHLEKRFGSWARSYVMLCFILTQLARMGTIFYAIAIAINVLTGFDIPLIILFSGICVIVYTVFGGMEAVIWTEVVQAVLKTMGALLILGIILYKIDIQTIVSEGLAKNKFNLGTFKPDFTQSSFWVVFVYGFFINLVNFGVDQNYIQRYHTAQSTKDAQKSIWQCVIYYVPVSFLFFFVGTALFVYYQYFPEQIQSLKELVSIEKSIALADLQASDYGDRVLPHFIKTKIPTGLLGLLMAALLSAAMSTMSSSMNSSATVFLKDFYTRYFKKNLNDLQQLKVLRIATICFGLLGISFGIAMIGAKSILDIWWKLSGIFAGGMLGIFLLGFLVKNAGKAAAIGATLVGVVVIAYLSLQTYLPENFNTNLEPKMTVAFGTLTIVGVGWLITKFVKR